MSAGAKVIRTPPTPRRQHHFVITPLVRTASHELLDPNIRHAARAARYSFDHDKDRIGTGCYGVVYRGTDTHTQESVAIKVIDAKAHKLRCEVSAMLRLRHVHIVRMLDVYLSGDLHIVYELAEHGDLFDWLVHQYEAYDDDTRPVLSRRTMARITLQLGGALAYCHAANIAHRDLKPENVLITNVGPDIEVKLGDFGICLDTTNSHITHEHAGSEHYAAPEVLLYPDREIDAFAADVWSFGVVLFVTAHYCQPWSTKRPLARVKRGRDPKLPQTLTSKIESHVRGGLYGILQESLDFCPEHRAPMKDLAREDRFTQEELEDTFVKPPLPPIITLDDNNGSDREIESRTGSDNDWH